MPARSALRSPPDKESEMQIKLANPRGFCAGVDRAIEIVNRALEVFSPPIYVRHEVVHNKFVVDDLRHRGAVFVDELDQVPDDGVVIFSAHGVSKAVQDEAARRGLKVFDATCPLVTKVHMEVVRYSRSGTEAILIGHEGHPEVEGTMGQYDCRHGGTIYLVEDEADVAALQVRDPEKLAFVTQTTLSVDDTYRVIDALRPNFRPFRGRARTTSVMPPRTVRMRSSNWRPRLAWCWWWALPTPPTPIACANWQNAWVQERILLIMQDKCSGNGLTACRWWV
jgi:(E)-4-hydroxy-3-methyl-but-2-enyl pyrophosphate reductase